LELIDRFILLVGSFLLIIADWLFVLICSGSLYIHEKRADYLVLLMENVFYGLQFFQNVLLFRG